MKQIRQSVFETNSSSAHTITVKGKDMTDKLRINGKDKKIHVEFGDFQGGSYIYDTAYEKLSYLITMVFMTNRDCKNMDEFMYTDEMREIEACIKNHIPECEGLVVDGEIYHEYGDTWNDISGDINHQSVVPIKYLFKGCTMEEFIFSSDIYISTTWEDDAVEDETHYVPSFDSSRNGDY